MDETEQNKSELPTRYKLDHARKKGSVARGTDLGFFISLVVFSAYLWVSGHELAAQLGDATRSALVAAPNVLASSNEILAVTGVVMTHAVRPILFLMAALFVAVLVFELVQTGVVFSTEPLKLDFSKLNPGKGLKRVFSVRILIETAKALLKFGVYVSLAWVVIREARDTAIPVMTDGAGLAAAMGRAGLKLLFLFAGAAAFFAALDQLIVRREFLKKMRMSRREVRRESRDREGDPRQKQKRKAMHAEFVKLSESLRNIRGADILVTNPTHYAVALKYDGRTMAAPKVVSLGSNRFALRLKRMAFLYGVTIVHNPPLARALYARGKLNQPIPEQLFRPVADLYLAMRETQDRLRTSRENA